MLAENPQGGFDVTDKLSTDPTFELLNKVHSPGDLFLTKLTGFTDTGLQASITGTFQVPRTLTADKIVRCIMQLTLALMHTLAGTEGEEQQKAFERDLFDGKMQYKSLDLKFTAPTTKGDTFDVEMVRTTVESGEAGTLTHLSVKKGLFLAEVEVLAMLREQHEAAVEA
jgi:hypothetical protein